MVSFELKTSAALIVLLIIAGVLWRVSRPKSVGYNDVLTHRTASTFAQYNSGWNGDDPNNVSYVQRAMKHLGNRAYGRKFGDLMDWEKHFLAQKFAEKALKKREAQEAYWKMHPTPTPEPLRIQNASELAQAESSSGDAVSAFEDIQQAEADAQAGSVTVLQANCPEGFSKAVSDAEYYLNVGSTLSHEEMSVLKDGDIEAAADAKRNKNNMSIMLLDFSTRIIGAYAKLGGNPYNIKAILSD